MSEDTRDIVIRTATKVEQLHTDMAAVMAKMAEMEMALAERRGAERVARWLIGLSSGTVAGAVGAFVSKFAGLLAGALR